VHDALPEPDELPAGHGVQLALPPGEEVPAAQAWQLQATASLPAAQLVVHGVVVGCGVVLGGGPPASVQATFRLRCGEHQFAVQGRKGRVR
jgi:hypothetical protein